MIQQNVKLKWTKVEVQVPILPDNSEGCAHMFDLYTGPTRLWNSLSYLPNCLNVQQLKLQQPDQHPSLAGVDRRPKHRRQHKLVTLGVGNDLQMPALTHRRTLKDIGHLGRRRWLTGLQRRAVHTTKSSSKQAKMVGCGLPNSVTRTLVGCLTTPSADNFVLSRVGGENADISDAYPPRSIRIR